MSRLISLALLLTLACAPTAPRAAPGPMAGPSGSATPERITSPSVPVLEGIPHAVRVGLVVYVSGMVPVDSAGQIIGAGDLIAQTRQVVANLRAVMRTARGVPGDVVKVTVYLKDATPGAVDTVRATMLENLDQLTLPAVTIVGVTSLPEPAMRVMIDATAHLRSEFPDRARMGGAPPARPM